MDNKTTIVTDPRNRQVHLPADLCLQAEAQGPLPPPYDAYAKVVETPACIIETLDQHVYYFRSLGWNFTVLIETVLYEGHWVATGCYKNPDAAYIQQLLRGGNFIAGATLN